MNQSSWIVTFRVGDRPCALPLAVVEEILPMATLTQPPALPALIAGYLNLGGYAVAVLRWDQLLGLPQRPLDARMLLLVAEFGGRRFALPVTQVEGISPAGQASPHSPVEAGEVFNDCVSAFLRVGNDTYSLLDPDRILLAEESRRLADFQEREQARLARLDAPGERMSPA